MSTSAGDVYLRFLFIGMSDGGLCFAVLCRAPLLHTQAHSIHNHYINALAAVHLTSCHYAFYAHLEHSPPPQT